ncbi:hypothetical protein ACFX10_045134 [Malus domestica]
MMKDSIGMQRKIPEAFLLWSSPLCVFLNSVTQRTRLCLQVKHHLRAVELRAAKPLKSFADREGALLQPVLPATVHRQNPIPATTGAVSDPSGKKEARRRSGPGTSSR